LRQAPRSVFAALKLPLELRFGTGIGLYIFLSPTQ
jgi:hypothetical protein